VPRVSFIYIDKADGRPDSVDEDRVFSLMREKKLTEQQVVVVEAPCVVMVVKEQKRKWLSAISRQEQQ
jgi:hypothetical protein